MKHLLLILLAVNIATGMNAQTTPVWTRDITALPDTAYVFPVKTAHDGNNNIYVLSTYSKTILPGQTDFKIYLKRFDASGNLAWSFILGGIDNPRGFDLAVDTAGNSFIAGGFISNSNFTPLIIRVNTAGNLVWQRDSTTAFNTGYFDNIVLKNNLLYLEGSSGIALFDANGSEQWSHALPAQQMAVDNAGRMIVSGFFPGNQSVFRYDVNGNLNFSDSTIIANRIAVDAGNGFYLLNDLPQYELVRYDSAGNYMWNKTFYTQPSFGDIGYEVLVDYNDDVILVGLNDTMYKFSSSGNLIWARSMFGSDVYMIAAGIAPGNYLAVAGTLSGFAGYDVTVSLYDLNGHPGWTGVYSSNFTQEFSVDMTIDNSGIYVIEDSISNTVLMKFDPFSSLQIDYTIVCVDSVWYDPGNPNSINVSVFNGNVTHLNYPSVQIVSPIGDTISNPTNFVNFFAHLGNMYQTYTDTITVTGITDFSNYTFLISQNFGDTTVVITWCNPTGIASAEGNEGISIFPNPAHDMLHISLDQLKGRAFNAELYNATGAKVFDKSFESSSASINISAFVQGIYLVRILDAGRIYHSRIIIE